MPTPDQPSRLVVRLAAAVGGLLAFLVAATAISPDWARADGDRPLAWPTEPAAEVAEAGLPADTVESEPGRSLGSLESTHEAIEIRATADGPRYRISASEGRTAGPWLTVEQLAMANPRLDLREAEAFTREPAMPGGRRPADLLMLADPVAGWGR